jgi:hypothetical protein
MRRLALLGAKQFPPSGCKGQRYSGFFAFTPFGLM